MSDKKYEFTGETKFVFGVTLEAHTCGASDRFIEAGTIGGWISSGLIFPAMRGCTAVRWCQRWRVYGDALVYGDARVSAMRRCPAMRGCPATRRCAARVSGNARVYGDARVSGDAQVSGDAWVSGDARVYGNAWVYGDAQVYGDARVYGDAQVYGNARVSKPSLSPPAQTVTFTLTHKGNNAPRIAAGCRFFTMKGRASIGPGAQELRSARRQIQSSITSRRMNLPRAH